MELQEALKRAMDATIESGDFGGLVDMERMLEAIVEWAAISMVRLCPFIDLPISQT
jgi:hypothetical protein